MGVVNQLGKFSPHVAEISAPLRKLLSTKTAWLWGPEQETYFKYLISDLTTNNSHILQSISAYQDLSRCLLIQPWGCLTSAKWFNMASSGLCVPFNDRHWGTLCTIRERGSDTHLGLWEVQCYILGKHIILETDHKPLVLILSYKHLDNLPPWVLRFRLRLMSCTWQISLYCWHVV